MQSKIVQIARCNCIWVARNDRVDNALFNWTDLELFPGPEGAFLNGCVPGNDILIHKLLPGNALDFYVNLGER